MFSCLKREKQLEKSMGWQGFVLCLSSKDMLIQKEAGHCLQYFQLKSIALHNENRVRLKLDSVLNVTQRSHRRLSGHRASLSSTTDVNNVVTAV